MRFIKIIITPRLVDPFLIRVLAGSSGELLRTIILKLSVSFHADFGFIHVFKFIGKLFHLYERFEFFHACVGAILS